MKSIRHITFLAAAAFASFSLADEAVSFKSLLQGKSGRKTSIKASELPAGYRAVRFESGGGTGGSLMDMIMSPMMMLGSAMNGAGEGADTGGMAALAIIDLSWTTGESISVEGQKYLVTYKLAFDLATMAASKSPDLSNSPLRLTLVRLDQVKGISFAPEMTKESLIKALKSAGKKPTPK